jgi:hypothetical protein
VNETSFKPIDLEDSYTIVTTDFLADGGDDFKNFANISKIKQPLMDKNNKSLSFKSVLQSGLESLKTSNIKINETFTDNIYDQFVPKKYKLDGKDFEISEEAFYQNPFSFRNGKLKKKPNHQHKR